MNRVAELEGLPKKLEETKNSIAVLKTTTEAETTKIKEETTEATKRLNESVAETNTNVKNIKQEQQKTSQSFEDYKKLEEKQRAKERLHERRQSRLNDSLREILTKGIIEEDLTMNDCFKRACEISPDFCKSYEELKKFHKDMIEFLKRVERFSKRFWELFERDQKMQELMDQPRTPAISGGGGGDSPVPILDAPDVKSRDEL